jgi:hypothetical protein
MLLAELGQRGPHVAGGRQAARARASELAVRAAHAFAVHRGARAALAGDVAERLSREAAFLLVFGSRAGIKDALLKSFDAFGTPDG